MPSNPFLKRDLREERLFNLLDKIKNNSRCNSSVLPINISKLSYLPFHKNISSTPNGFVYLLISLNPTSPETFYVGETERALLTRLSEHNCGNGSEFTRTPHRLPWAVAAFVCNFSSRFSRRDFEQELHREMRVRHNNLKNLKDMVSLFQEKVNEKTNLHFCVCGEMQST